MYFIQVQYKDLTATDRRRKGWRTIDEDISAHVRRYEVPGLRPGKIDTLSWFPLRLENLKNGRLISQTGKRNFDQAGKVRESYTEY